jgi:hypothetical protein
MRSLPQALRSLVALGRRTPAPEADPRGGDVACRNCGTDAPGAFCPACGQETSLKLPKATTFLREAAGRYVAFDGRMWRTLAALAFRPGLLTREYFAGRRKRYVRPARLVLVLAIVLFAVARLYADPDDVVRIGVDDAPAGAPTAAGEAPRRPAAVQIDDEPMAIGIGPGSLRIDPKLNVSLTGIVPFSERITRTLERFNRLDRAQKSREIAAGMLRYGPYALIAMLPAFALLMMVLHLGRGDRYPMRPRRYAEHLVYGAHNHAFVALAIALIIVSPHDAITTAIVAWGAIYLVASMRVVYGGRWLGTIARAAVAIVAYGALVVAAVIGLLVAAILLR